MACHAMAWQSVKKTDSFIANLFHSFPVTTGLSASVGCNSEAYYTRYRPVIFSSINELYLLARNVLDW